MTDRSLPENVAAEILYLRAKSLYADYRTEWLNRLYYGRRLARAKRWNSFLEILLAMGTSTAVGAWAIWNMQIGRTVWAGLAGVACIVAILKPVLQLSRQIERYTKLFVEHGAIFYDLGFLVKELEAQRCFTREMEISYKRIYGRLRDLASFDDPKPDKKLVRLCCEEVNAQISPEDLWWPERSVDHGKEEKGRDGNSAREDCADGSNRLRAAEAA